MFYVNIKKYSHYLKQIFISKFIDIGLLNTKIIKFVDNIHVAQLTLKKNMPQWSKISKIFGLNLLDKCNEINIKKTFIIHLFSILGVLFLLPFAVYNLIEGLYIRGIFESVAALLFILNLVILNFRKQWKFSGYLFIFLCAILFIYLLISTQHTKAGHLWILLFPPIAIYIMDMKKGVILSGIYLLIIIVLCFFPQTTGISYLSQTSFGIRLTTAYLLLLLISSSYGTIQNISHKLQKRKIQDSMDENKTIEEYISDLSHQIRIPLNNIMVVSNLLGKSKLNSQQKDLVDTVTASTNNLVNIVNHIARYSQIEMLDRHEEMEFNIYSAIKNILTLYNDENIVDIDLDFPVSLQKNNIIGDPIAIKQVFLNIIENLLLDKKTSVNIKIQANLHKDAQCRSLLNFNILTNRIIKQDYNNKGDFYYVAENETYYSDFSIAREIIKKNSNGGLHIMTTSDRTSFLFSFLFKELQPDTTKETESQGSPLEEKEEKGKGKVLKDARILLVEDNLVNQKIVNLSLSKSVKKIDIANNGQEAIEQYNANDYDIILMDVKMPVMDGITATKKIREMEIDKDHSTPIIAITANALTGDKEKCITAGMDEYISKPFQIEDLLEKIEHLL